jgi:hypothetical protein
VTRKKGWRRVKYEGPAKRRFATAFEAAASLHDGVIAAWGQGRVEQHEEHGQAPLYHFTSSTGLAGILSTGHFWATHIRDFDDPAELRHAFAIAADMVEAALARATSRCVRAVLTGVKTALTTFEDHFDLYVVSLCERHDLEDMWKDYADQDRGFAFEIVPDGDPDRAPTREDKPVLILRKVIYDEAHQRELFNAVIERVVGEVETLVHMYGEFGAKNPARPFWLLLLQLLLDYSAAFKQQEPYAGEREWRYLCNVGRGTTLAQAAKVRARGDKQVRYMEIDLWSQRHGDLKIQRLLHGLACTPEQIATASELLTQAGRVDVNIEARTAASKP